MLSSACLHPEMGKRGNGADIPHNIVIKRRALFIKIDSSYFYDTVTQPYYYVHI